jgi:23S rRNA (uridine2552-2'-O)-methyltransferase
MKFCDARKDPFRNLAREKGYRSRSAFKLIELDRKYRLLSNAKSIVDIGCSPGGWLQVAYEFGKKNARIIGVDISPTRPLYNITMLRANIEDPDLAEALLKISQASFDLLLSDLSPNISGLWDYDHMRQISISLRALQLATEILGKGGNAVFKIFEGEMINEFKSKVSNIFSNVRVCKPKASRQESSELYIIGKNLERNWDRQLN